MKSLIILSATCAVILAYYGQPSYSDPSIGYVRQGLLRDAGYDFRKYKSKKFTCGHVHIRESCEQGGDINGEQCFPPNQHPATGFKDGTIDDSRHRKVVCKASNKNDQVSIKFRDGTAATATGTVEKVAECDDRGNWIVKSLELGGEWRVFEDVYCVIREK